MDDVRKIAERLSRDARKLLKTSGESGPLSLAVGRNLHASIELDRFGLRTKGLSCNYFSPLGLAVRAYLKDQEHG